MQKELYKYLYYLTIVIAAVTFLIVLPNFSLDLHNGSKLEWRGLSSLGVSENLFNFARGSGLYNSNNIEFKAEQSGLDKDTFLLSFDVDKQTILGRMQSFNQQVNASVTGREYQDTDNTRTLSFQFPEYVTNAAELASNLTVKGQTSIAVSGASDGSSGDQNQSIISYYFPGYTAVDSGLSINDIVSFKVDSSSLFTVPVLRTQFSADSADKLQSAFGNTQYDTSGNPKLPLLIIIDGFPAFWAFPPTLGGLPANTPFPTDIIWVPLSDTEQLQVTTKAASIFGLPLNLTYTQTTKTTSAPEYAPNGRVVIGILFILIFALLVVRAISLYKLTAGLYYALALGSFVTISITLGKLVNLALEPVVLVGFAVALGFVGVMLLRVMKGNLDSVTAALSNQAYLAIILFLVISVLLQFPAFRLVQGLDMLVVMSVAWFISVMVSFRGVLYMYYQSRDEG